MHFNRLLMLSVSAVLFAACSRGEADQHPVEESVRQATLPQNMCALMPQRDDDSGCHYQDAGGTTGTSLWIFLNAFRVSDQCRLTPGSEPLSGVGDEACIAIRQPDALYTTVVFGGGGRTFEVIAPGKDRDSELATAVARVILSKLGS
jgi:hypothetical protein